MQELEFQSTLPRRKRRLVPWVECEKADDFNPRFRVGSDEVLSDADKKDKNFNPRFRVGSDCKTAQNTLFHFVLIS